MLAGFAPVGDTGLIVIIQQDRDDEAVAPYQKVPVAVALVGARIVAVGEVRRLAAAAPARRRCLAGLTDIQGPRNQSGRQAGRQDMDAGGPEFSPSSSSSSQLPYGCGAGPSCAPPPARADKLFVGADAVGAGITGADVSRPARFEVPRGRDALRRSPSGSPLRLTLRRRR